MKINEIISETTTSGVFASVAFPMTPGTKPADARKAVDPHGYLTPGKKKKTKMGYSADVGNLVYNTPVNSKMIKR